MSSSAKWVWFGALELQGHVTRCVLMLQRCNGMINLAESCYTCGAWSISALIKMPLGALGSNDHSFPSLGVCQWHRTESHTGCNSYEPVLSRFFFFPSYKSENLTNSYRFNKGKGIFLIFLSMEVIILGENEEQGYLLIYSLIPTPWCGKGEEILSLRRFCRCQGIIKFQ